MEKEIFPPSNPNQHLIEPMDPDNISWEQQWNQQKLDNPLIFNQHYHETNAFICALGVAILFLVLYSMNKLQAIQNAFTSNQGKQ